MSYRLFNRRYPIGFIGSKEAQGRQAANLIWRWYRNKKGSKTPEKATEEKAKKRARKGKPPSTAAAEFVHEEIEHVRQGKHGARSPQQAIAIGLSKARRAGIPLAPPSSGKTK